MYKFILSGIVLPILVACSVSSSSPKFNIFLGEGVFKLHGDTALHSRYTEWVGNFDRTNGGRYFGAIVVNELGKDYLMGAITINTLEGAQEYVKALCEYDLRNVPHKCTVIGTLTPEDYKGEENTVNHYHNDHFAPLLREGKDFEHYAVYAVANYVTAKGASGETKESAMKAAYAACEQARIDEQSKRYIQEKGYKLDQCTLFGAY